MPRRIALLALAVVTAFAAVPGNAGAEDAKSILDTVRAKQAERWATVKNYTVTVSVRDAMGAETPIYYEKMEVDGRPTFRMVPPTEYMRETQEEAGFPPMSSEALEEYAKGLTMLGDAMAVGGGDQPPMDVRGMTGDMSAFLMGAAAYEEDDGRGDAAENVRQMAQFAERARLEGTDKISASGKSDATREAYRLVADDLSDIELEQPKGDAVFTLEKVSLWIDKKEYVPLRLLMEGQVESKGKKTPMTIEKLDLDYAPAGPLYESRQQVFKLGGMGAAMSEKDKKEFEKARKEMEKAKKEMEKLPPQQKEMVMKMMGDKMAQFESMAQGGGELTSITDVVSIAVNEGPPTPYGMGSLNVGGPAAADYPKALTYAGDDGHAELAVVARIPGQAQASIGLVGAGGFPGSGEVVINAASGRVELEGGVSIAIEEGTGTITVTERTETRIAGTYTALLKGSPSTADDDTKVQFSVSGKFDSGAPVGPVQAPRGSPFPADLFEDN